jgi:GT2 family glycosyltransferase
MKNELFAIGIPTINRADLLNPTLEKYLHDFPETMIIILDNGNQRIIEHERIMVMHASRNFGVAKSWNWLHDMIFTFLEKPYALILNDDIYLGKFEYQIKDTIHRHIEMPFLTNTGTWCSYITPYKTWQQVGRFDENIYPAYYEDDDYSYRLKLAGLPHFPTNDLKPLNYINSGSIKRDASLNLRQEKNKQYYIEKWGGMPGQETFTVPNNKTS